MLVAEAGAIAPLVRLMGDGDVEVRRKATETLSRIAGNVENQVLVAEADAIPSLVRLLGDTDVEVRQKAAEGLMNMSIGDENKVLVVMAGAIVPLVQLLRDSDAEMRWKAAGANAYSHWWFAAAHHPNSWHRRTTSFAP